jgi:hypothetical protein
VCVSEAAKLSLPSVPLVRDTLKEMLEDKRTDGFLASELRAGSDDAETTNSGLITRITGEARKSYVKTEALGKKSFHVTEAEIVCSASYLASCCGALRRDRQRQTETDRDRQRQTDRQIDG